MATEDAISVDCYIVVEQRFKERYGGINPEGRPGLRITKMKPELGRDEVPVRITISIPRAYWIRPAIHASVTLPDIEHDAELHLAVAEDVGRQISEAMSMRVDVQVVAPHADPGQATGWGPNGPGRDGGPGGGRG